MHDTVAHELSVTERRDHGEHALLLTEFQVGLAADQIVQRTVRVVAAQLEHGIRVLTGFRVRQADRLENAEPQRVKAAACVNLDGHAALEYLGILKAVYRCFLSGGQRVPECLVLLAGERAVDIIRRALAVAGSLVGGIHIDALSRDNRRGGIVKVQEIAAHLGVDGLEQRIRGQRAGSDDHSALRNLGHFTVDHLDIRVVLDLLGDGCREGFAVNRQCAACLNAMCIRTGEDKAVQTAQLLLEQTGGVRQLIRAQRVGAHQLGEIVRVVRRRVLHRLHLTQAHGDTALC